MEKQYNDLIVSLIEKHPKYPGHESILNEIVEDVFQHARVVISSVTNEDVIVSYLNKVVSNSIVTVAKKNNINVRHRHTVNSILSSIDNQKVKQEVVAPKEDSRIATQATVVEEINPSQDLELQLSLENEIPVQDVVAEVESVEVFEAVEEVTEEVADVVVPDSEETTLSDEEFVEKLYLDNSSELNNEEIISPIETENEPIIEEPLEEQAAVVEEIKPDMELVDKMINGVSDDSLTTIETTSESDSSDIIDSLDEIDTLDIMSEISEPEIDDKLEVNNVESENLVILDEADELATEQEETAVEFAQKVAMDVALEDFILADDDEGGQDIIEELPEVSEELPEQLIEADDSETSEEEVRVEEVEVVVALEEASDVVEISENNLLEETLEIDDSEDNGILELDADSGIDDFLSISDDTVIDLEESSSENAPVSRGVESRYSIFAFEPDKDASSYNSDEIISLLNDFNKKHPEYRVIEIAEMKYSENLSISDVAKNLGFTEDKVIEILNEIIDIVKD